MHPITKKKLQNSPSAHLDLHHNSLSHLAGKSHLFLFPKRVLNVLVRNYKAIKYIKTAGGFLMPSTQGEAHQPLHLCKLQNCTLRPQSSTRQHYIPRQTRRCRRCARITRSRRYHHCPLTGGRECLRKGLLCCPSSNATQIKTSPKKPRLSVLTSTQYTPLAGIGSNVSAARANVNTPPPFASGASIETPVMRPSDVVVVIPPSAMSKLLERTEVIVYVLCRIYGVSARSLRRGVVKIPRSTQRNRTWDLCQGPMTIGCQGTTCKSQEA